MDGQPPSVCSAPADRYRLPDRSLASQRRTRSLRLISGDQGDMSESLRHSPLLAIKSSSTLPGTRPQPSGSRCELYLVVHATARASQGRWPASPLFTVRTRHLRPTCLNWSAAPWLSVHHRMRLNGSEFGGQPYCLPCLRLGCFDHRHRTHHRLEDCAKSVKIAMHRNSLGRVRAPGVV